MVCQQSHGKHSLALCDASLVPNQATLTPYDTAEGAWQYDESSYHHHQQLFKGRSSLSLADVRCIASRLT